MTSWQISAASVIGASHADSGSPCQDAHCCIESEDGKWLAMVVSDGAGTAKFSDKSSSLVVNSFAKALIELSREIELREPGAWINDFVIGHVLSTRNELRNLAKSDNLKEYHCTLVACLLGDTGGFIIHIGDGAAFGGVTKYIDSAKYSLSEHRFASLPENGEYSNETFFITEGDWIKHLRITPISSADWIILATDGGTALAMVADKEPKSGFIDPLIASLAAENDSLSRNNIVATALGDPQADKLTSDDKTICLAYRKRSESLNNQIELQTTVEEQSENKSLNIISSSTTLSSENSVQLLQQKWEKNISLKLQITKRLIVGVVLMIMAIIIALWAHIHPEIAKKCINSTKGIVYEIIGSSRK